MHVNVLVQALLFLSSYSPLFAVFALLDTFGRGWPSITCVVAAAVGAACLPLLFVVDRATAPQALHVSDSNPRDSDVLAYVASYLVPFADFDTEDARQRVAVLLFVALIAVLYVRLQLFYVNPLLALVGYRVYQVTSRGGTSVILLSRRSFMTPDSTVQAVRLSSYVWREKQ